MAISACYFFYAAVWIGWCFFHSFLISPAVIGIFENRLGTAFRYYRCGYNVFSLLSLAGPLYFTHYLAAYEEQLIIWGGWYEGARYGLLAAAFALFWAGAQHYDLSYFLGIAQIRRGSASLLMGEQESFSTSGVAGFVRHPWYLGGILFVWAMNKELRWSTIIGSTIISAYFIIGSVLEEHKLLRHYGAIYRSYQEQVSMLLPVKWCRRKITLFNKKRG